MYIFVVEIRRLYIFFLKARARPYIIIIIIIIIIIELDLISSLIVSLLANKEKAGKKKLSEKELLTLNASFHF